MTLALLNATDGFALSMVLILTLGLGVVALLLGSIARHGKRRDHELEALLDELRREEADQGQQAAVSTSAEPTAPREPWERDGDWWKK